MQAREGVAECLEERVKASGSEARSITKLATMERRNFSRYTVLLATTLECQIRGRVTENHSESYTAVRLFREKLVQPKSAALA